MPYTQEQINEGQKRINYELNEVDKKIIEALRALMQVIKNERTTPPSKGSKQMDFTTVEAALAEASTESDEVADIDPPGCQGPYPD